MDPNAVISLTFSRNKKLDEIYNEMVKSRGENIPQFECSASKRKCKVFYLFLSFLTTIQKKYIMILVKRTSTITFTDQRMKHQKLSIRRSLLNYILDNASANLVSKFFRTCKYFYFQKPLCIVESIFLSANVLRIEIMNLNYKFDKIEDIEMFDNIWVSDEITVMESCPKMLLNKVVRCHSVWLHNQELPPVNECAFAKISSSIKKWSSFTANVVSGAGTLLSLHELFSHFPNATEIE